MGQVGDDKRRGNILQGGHGGCVWFWVGWVRRGYAVVEPTDKDVIAFCGEMEFVSPVQIWIIQGGWQFVEKTNSGNNS